MDEAEEKEQLKQMTEKYRPLLDYLKKKADTVVRDGKFLSVSYHRLV